MHPSHRLFASNLTISAFLGGVLGHFLRSRDGHLVHANIHTDLVIAQEPLDPSCTHKPAEVYRVIEDFCLGRRRLELFGDIANVRDGWVCLFPWDETLE
jgi:N6-adenosine-specific RNA methylase IME4